MFHGLMLPRYLGEGCVGALRWGLCLPLLYLLPMVLAYWVGPEQHHIAKGTRLCRLVLLVVALELLTWVWPR